MNKKGGGHRKALAFLSKKKGDAHFLEIESPTMFGKNIVGKSPYSYDSVTPIAMLYEEYMALAVPLNSKLKSANEIVRILKKDPTALSLGISGSPGSGTHISIAMPLKALGIDITKLRTVVFGGGKQLVVAIIGGHVDYGGSGLTNLGKSMKDGKLRLLAHTGTVRLKGYLKSVPPWKDLGANIKFSVWRAVVGPLGLSKDQIAFWGGVIAKVIKNKRWKKVVKKRGYRMIFKTGKEATKDFKAKYIKIKQILTTLGLAKKK